MVVIIASSGSTKKDKNAAEIREGRFLCSGCVLCEILHLKDERAVTTLRHFL